MLYHGAHTKFETHTRQCFTDDLTSAITYAQFSGQVACVTLDLDGLTVAECDAYDHDSDTAIGDDGAAPDCDVLVYSDEDASGRTHKTWRLMTQVAIDALGAIGLVDITD